ncbi:hypothetical protein K431DRAFT_306354 [Polychaeton citri CBS 116435]|uniref:Uncharacterized protein n=1 Tax=Polychaeton citri CBS 116435 TaxID=1314669 RepID=A0A9P4UL44_9PEZI|nr:hypothetical protein K431DRAFT_306354 [Polychaeton citri CBS 116435]
MREILVTTLKAIKDGRSDDPVALLRNGPSLFIQGEISRILVSAEVPLLTLQALLDHRWNINEPQSFVTPPLLVDIVENETAAAQYAPPQIVELIFERGGIGDRGEPINFAIRRKLGDLSVIPSLRLLLSNGAPPDLILYERYPKLKDLTMSYTTPSASCCAKCREDEAQLLLQHGADP